MINTCLLLPEYYRTLALYTHLVPLGISVIIIMITLIKGQTYVGRAFAWFTALFSLWLVGDLVLWVVPNYTLIYTIWSVLDFINVLFCLAAVYFFYTLVANNKYTSWIVGVLMLVAIPPLVVNVMGLSVSDLSYTYCEVTNNTFLTYYKLAVEIITTLWITISAIVHIVKKDADRMIVSIIAVALVLFLGTFSATDHIASLTGVYEIGLYGLLALPVSLFLILFTIIRGNVFHLRAYGIQVGVCSFIVLVASQLLFIQSNLGRVLNALTFVLSIAIAYVLTRQVNQEHSHLGEIEILNSRLEKANGELIDLNQQKNEFLSLATHQLRSPLTSIKWGMEALEDEGLTNLTETQKTTFLHIETTTNDLIRVVGDLLDVSKAEQGKLVLNKTDIDIEKLVQKVVDEFTVVAAHKNLQLLSDIRIITKPLTYNGDETKLQQAITNLIDNAIKYTSEGVIRVALTEDGRHIYIAVSDTGAGVPEQEIPTLFTKFMRGSAGKHASGGSGLGLYLVKQVIEMHGGTVTVTSGGMESGSTFTITLVKE